MKRKAGNEEEPLANDQPKSKKRELSGEEAIARFHKGLFELPMLEKYTNEYAQSAPCVFSSPPPRRPTCRSMTLTDLGTDISTALSDHSSNRRCYEQSETRSSNTFPSPRRKQTFTRFTSPATWPTSMAWMMHRSKSCRRCSSYATLCIRSRFASICHPSRALAS